MVALRAETGYPWTGAVTVRVVEAPGGRWRIAQWVPSWAEGATLARTGRVAPGIAGAEAEWRPGDELRLDLPMTPRWTRPDPRIDAVRGCVALERGPLVYCAESGGDLGAVAVDTSAEPEEGRILDTVALTGTAYPVRTGSGRPYGPASVADGIAGAVPLTFVPYHRWGNRGPSAMHVWPPELRR